MTSDPLFTCPLCQTPGFTARGLSGHQCTGVNRRTGEGRPIVKRRLTMDEYLTALGKAITRKYTSR